MKIQFKNAYLEKLFQGRAVPGKPRYSNDLVVKFKKTILKLSYAEDFNKLREQRGLNLESLKGNLKGFFSVRVDKSYRLLLSVEKNGMVKIKDVVFVHDLTNHYQ